VVGQPDWQPRLQANTRVFMEGWVQRPEFVAEYPRGMPAREYVSKLFQRAGVTPTATEFETAVADYGDGDAEGRVRALRDVVSSRSVTAAHQSPAFVLMEYFGYLRRDPDAEGYDHWLTKLNQFGGNFYEAEMVKAFISSIEYRQRFGQ
jgi:hypothetical protein